MIEKKIKKKKKKKKKKRNVNKEYTDFIPNVRTFKN